MASSQAEHLQTRPCEEGKKFSAMNPSFDLGDPSIWDDRALIKDWDACLAEYQVLHSSLIVQIWWNNTRLILSRRNIIAYVLAESESKMFSANMNWNS
jgi:hypothetical protein